MDSAQPTPVSLIVDALLGSPAGRDRVLEILQEVEARLPGSIDQMAATLQLRRLQPPRAQSVA